MAAYAHDSSFVSRRAIALIVIIAFHLLLLYALESGLARRAIELVAPPIQTDIIEEVQQHELPPPPPPPEFERPPVEVPPPDIAIDIPVEPQQSTAITDVTDKPVAKVAGPPHVSVHVSAKPSKNFPNSEDFYPAASKRLSEEGSATIHICVGPGAKLTEDPTVVKTSGSLRLDEAAIRLAKAASGRGYIAPTEDGKPITECFPLSIRFKLQN